MPPEKKKTIFDYAKIGSIWALIISLWSAGYKVGELKEQVKAKVVIYDGYGDRLDKLESMVWPGSDKANQLRAAYNKSIKIKTP